MSKQYLKTSCPHGNRNNDCTICRACQPRTFSNFMDKVVSILPVSTPKQTSKLLSQNPNSPIEVLANKGLLNISQNPARAGDGCSEVDFSLYAEESHRGETVKVFNSNHHFKNGKLVYSSTQEQIPDLPQDVHKCSYWWKRNCPTSRPAIKNTKSDILYNRSTRKKITDIQDVERPKVIQHYESAAQKRYRRCKSASPIRDTLDVRDKDNERFLHTLRAQSIRRRSSPCSPKSSPSRYLYRVAYKHSPSEVSSKKPVLIRSCSEISITSKESWHSTTGSTIQKSSRHVKFQKTSTPRIKKDIKKDLFVIPSHTCHRKCLQELRQKSKYASQRGKASKFIHSPEFKCYMYHPITSDDYTDHEEISCRRVPQISKLHQSELDYKIVRSPSGGSRRIDAALKRCHEGMISRREKTSQSNSRHKYQKYPSNVPQERVRHSAQYAPHDTYGKTAQRQKQKDRSYSRDKKGKAEKSSRKKYRGYEKNSQFRDAHRTLKHGIRDNISSGEPFGHIAARYRRIERPYDTTSVLENSSRLSPLYISTDSESERDTWDASSNSETSICSFYYCERSPRKSQKNSEYEHYHEDRRHHHKHYYTDTATKSRAEEDIQKSRGRRKIKQGEIIKQKHKFISPNKTVNLGNACKKLNQHDLSVKVGFDSGKAFKNKGKIHSKKVTVFSRSPPIADMKCYAKIHKRNMSNHEIIYAKDTIPNHIRLCPESQLVLNIIENAVNRDALQEYREHFARSTTHRCKKDNTARADYEKFDEYQLDIKEDNISVCDHDEECDACRIEQLLGDD